MSISAYAGCVNPRIVSAETMYDAIMDLGIVPFFENAVRGWSVEEMTPHEYWFDGDVLGPWDWKIDCVQSGDIVYGKFLGGKAAFASVRWYRELRAWRLSRLSPVILSDVEKSRTSQDAAILDYIGTNGAITIKEVRGLLGVKKAAADAAVTRLQMQCRVVTGDLTRVYRGPDLHYNGWQVASFTTPESLYGPSDFPFGRSSVDPLSTEGTPAESLERLLEHISEVSGCKDRKKIMKVVGN